MNKKLIISLGLIIAVSATTAAYAESTTIYTDGIGRIHFLGRDAANDVKTGANYANSESKELTKKLYEKSSEVIEDTSYEQHPLKNYSNTFPSSRFNEVKYWQPVDEETAKAAKAGKSTTSNATAVKGKTDYSGNGSTELDNPYVEKKETVDKVKKIHWWWKK